MSECEHEFGDYDGVYVCTFCGTVVVVLGFIPREDEEEETKGNTIVLKIGSKKISRNTY